MKKVVVTIVVCILVVQFCMAASPDTNLVLMASEIEDKYDLPNGLLLAIAEVESDFNAGCKTGKCWGLMQIHSTYAPEYAKLAGMDEFDLFDPEDSMNIAAAMLRDYMDRYEGDIHFTLMAYNLGEWGARSRRSNGVQDTRYSRKVVSKIEEYANLETSTLARVMEDKITIMYGLRRTIQGVIFK